MEIFLEKTNFGVGEVSNLIYHVRGRDVMLDADLARIYGYTTSAFNQQVARNLDRFEGEDFMFKLTRRDLDEISLSQNVIAMQTQGMKGGRSTAPYAFTEQGIYMLMTVLKGELAVKQSRALVMAFKEMKDYILENRNLLDQKEQLLMIEQVTENGEQIKEMKKVMNRRLNDIEARMENVVLKNELSPILLDFNKKKEREEFIFINGEILRAREVYQNIFSEAEKSITIIDDYVDIRTLRLLVRARKGVSVTIFSDNTRNYLHRSDYEDFRRERPDIKIDFVTTRGLIHDRFIVLDLGEKTERFYHCGGSSKDAGKRITAVSESGGSVMRRAMQNILEMMKKNQELDLK